MNQNLPCLFRSGASAEIMAAIRGDPALTRWRDPQGVSVLLWAVYTGQTMVRDFLRSALADQAVPLDIFEAAATGDELRLTALLAADPAAALAYSGDGWTPLHLAAAFGTPACVAALLHSGAPTNAVSTNAQRNQPLHAALALGREAESITLLLAHGADPNATQASGFTPIFSAAAANRQDLAELLLAYGANVQHANDQGKTAVDFALERGHTALADWLAARTA